MGSDGPDIDAALELIRQWEDEADLEIVRQRINEPGEPWEKVRAELGLGPYKRTLLEAQSSQKI